MPNWMSDRDAALEYGDATTCEYCGHFEYVQVGMSIHICEGMRQASKDRAETFERNYIGKGKKVTKRLTIEITAYDTESAFESALTMVEFHGYGNSGRDEVMDCEWTSKIEVIK